ncbi:hypothetical protein M441DRAFT_264478 [Trichoderma asperellum CBS 433.97]|uniref:Uncharacterized protein n=1 Tax=Trichoderma asperellum (strain ATCC 204424 / CBS 433.97 / NBRC 101777) TaxID=1042311 RepID=A0A2T3YXH9_TRIA4|nr:hypothetical protein M441DRAFT_264478 [Trichoderma asperellum CBS 433.97]PTB37252.1 hypothetical protein M441DRAFT_264478 [Trichoderma asperellum CBS 433.97]
MQEHAHVQRATCAYMYSKILPWCKSGLQSVSNPLCTVPVPERRKQPTHQENLQCPSFSSRRRPHRFLRPSDPCAMGDHEEASPSRKFFPRMAIDGPPRCLLHLLVLGNAGRELTEMGSISIVHCLASLSCKPRPLDASITTTLSTSIANSTSIVALSPLAP